MSLVEVLNVGNIRTHVVWIVITFMALIIAMVIDLITGVRKAKKNGIARTSTGYKMTTEKAGKYFLPMICTVCVDMIASCIIPLPIFTMLLGAWNTFCEAKSVTEKYYEKKELRDAANTMQVVIKNKDDLAKMIFDIIKDQSNERKETTISTGSNIVKEENK